MLLSLWLLACTDPFPCASDQLLDAKGACHDLPDTGSPAQTDTGDSDTATHAGDSASPECASTCDCGSGELCYDGACAAAGPELEIYRARLDAVVAAMDPTSGGFSSESAYPTEALMSLASGAWLLCDEGLDAAARVRADFAQSWENEDHLLVWSGYPYLTRDYNARHVYNLWAAGRALDEPALREAADATALAMLELDRVEYGDWRLFCVAYETTPPYACHDGYTWIDVNQNAELGLTFALLAGDPESALYQDPTAIEIAEHELAAAISIQDPSGAIPLAEGDYLDDFDTLYGSYAAWSWALAEAARPALPLDTPLDLAAEWLAPYSDETPTSHRTYPYPYDGAISLSEGAMRLPVLARAGALDPSFVASWWTETVQPNTETYSTWMPLWLMFNGGLPLDQVFPPAE